MSTSESFQLSSSPTVHVLPRYIKESKIVVSDSNINAVRLNNYPTKRSNNIKQMWCHC